MDTAANSLAFAIHELARQPDLVPALVEEVDGALADGVTVEALQRMPMLIRFLFEVLRLHPIAPALERHLLSDIEFGGHQLSAGTHVILATTVTHGLLELFAEPDRFDPTRFSPERAEHRTAGAYVPFGVGTHTCARRASGLGRAKGVSMSDEYGKFSMRNGQCIGSSIERIYITFSGRFPTAESYQGNHRVHR